MAVSALALTAGAAFYLWQDAQRLAVERVRAAADGVVSALEAHGDAADAARVTDACSGSSGSSACACAVAAAGAALDRNLHADARRVLGVTGDRCGRQLEGLQAEALARAGKLSRARALAESILTEAPGEPYATHAIALIHQQRGEVAQATKMARLAEQRGRGHAARLLLGNLAFGKGDLAAAKSEYEQLQQQRPDSANAAYNLAVVAHREGRYRDAREGYLHVLKLNPGQLDARFNLALLVHSAGATAEAQHHLRKLQEAASPGDERVARLQRALSSRPPAAGNRVLHPADGGAPPAPSSSAR